MFKTLRILCSSILFCSVFLGCTKKVSKNVDKVEHTREFTCCKHSYESLITTTKAFVLSFNNLYQEEKASFKSLHAYVKQLQKCMDSLKTQQTQQTQKSVKKDELNESKHKRPSRAKKDTT